MHNIFFLLVLPSVADGSGMARSAIDPRRLHDEGLQHLRKRSAAPARALLSQLEAAAPDSGFTKLLQGHCAWLLEGDVTAAEVRYESACAAFDTIDRDGTAEALHSSGRLMRQQQRWQEADEFYARAVTLRPSSAALAEEALYVRGKKLLLTEGGMAPAAEAFERGLKDASAAWKPHFAQEAAHCRGLCGDAVAAARHYRVALELRALPNASVVGELLSTLAAHHEREHLDIPTAAAFLHAARDAFNDARCAVEAKPALEVDAVARSHVRLAQTNEALHALGERISSSTTADAAADADADAGDADGALGSVLLRAAAQSYRAALAVQPNLISAHDDLAALLLGTSRLCNFGAAHAAALNRRAATALLREAERLEFDAAADGKAGVGPANAPADVPSGHDATLVDDGEEAEAATESPAARRSAQLEALEATEREVAEWQRIVASLPPPPPAADGAVASSSPARAWPLSAVVRSRAQPVPRVRVESSAELMRLLAERRPMIITNLQEASGFAPATAWQAASLRAQLGERVGKVSVSPSGRFDGAEDGSLWGLPTDEVLVRPPETHMRFADLLDLLQAPTPESFYLEYNALHQYLGAPARAMAPVPPQASLLRPLLTNLWLGKGATTSPLHYDEYENLLAQVAGTKELLLFPPADYPHLEYTARPKGTLRYRWPSHFERAPIDERARAHRVVFAASVNLTHPDERRTAALARCSPMLCELRAGETLLLPAYWHHEVHSHAAPAAHASDRPLNVAVNFWFRNETAPPPCFS